MFTFLTGCKEDTSPVDAVASNGVAGTWVDKELGLEMMFNADGTITGSYVDVLNMEDPTEDLPKLTWTFMLQFMSRYLDISFAIIVLIRCPIPLRIIAELYVSGLKLYFLY